MAFTTAVLWYNLFAFSSICIFSFCSFKSADKLQRSGRRYVTGEGGGQIVSQKQQGILYFMDMWAYKAWTK